MPHIIDEYATLLKITPPNSDKVFWKKTKNVRFRKKLVQIMNINAKIIDQVKKQKGKSECLSWDFLKKHILENGNDDRVPTCLLWLYDKCLV